MSTIMIPGMSQTSTTYFTSLINAFMVTERKPITRLQGQRSSLSSLVTAYNALDSRLSSLGSAIDLLQDTSSSVFGARSTSVSDQSDPDRTTITASANSSAAVGTYVVSVTSLAQAHRAASDQQVSATAALGLEGVFVIGGVATRSVQDENTVADTVTDFGVNTATDAIASDQRELGPDTYYVEIRDSENELQFRVVDSQGEAVSILDAESDDGETMSSGWQDLDLVDGAELDTGRGLTITFSAIGDHSVDTENTVADTVDDFLTSAVREGQSELDAGTYHVEVRENGADDWEFRLVDDTGTAVSVYNAEQNDGTFTTDWQDIDDVLANFTGGEFETGRGLSIDFGEGTYTAGTRGAGAANVHYVARQTQLGTKGAGAANVTYNAQGASITVTSDDSLTDIASAIRAATYAENAGVAATVVDRRLVVSADSTGADYAIRVSETSGTVVSSGIGLITGTDTFKNTGAESGYQAPTDASFSINGVAMTRSANSGLTNVISGVTLDLASDAEGESATLTISTDISGVVSQIDSFLSAFNSLQSYIAENTGVTVSGSGEEVTYTRNTLSGETVLSRLRSSLFSEFGQNMTDVPAGAPTTLRELGITLDDSLNASISDQSALEAALADDFEGVETFFDAIMTEFEDALSPFTATNGIVDSRIDASNNRIENIDDRIEVLEDRLTRRKARLEQQYGYLQVELAQMGYLQQQLGSFWGALSGTM